MKWVKTCAGLFINLDHVAQFSFLRGGDNVNEYQIRLRIEYPDERAEEHVIYKSDYSDMADVTLKQNDQFYPSPPGYFALYYTKEEDDEPIVMRDAILAWVLDTDLDGYHSVITTWDVHKSLGPCTAVLCPDGTVVVPGSSRYEDEKSWLEAMQKLSVDKAA